MLEVCIEIHCCCYTVELWRKNEKNALSMIFFSKARSHLLSMMIFSKARSHASIVDDLVEREIQRDRERQREGPRICYPWSASSSSSSPRKVGRICCRSSSSSYRKLARSHMLSIIFSSSRKLTCTWLQIEQIYIRQAFVDHRGGHLKFGPLSFPEVFSARRFFFFQMKMIENNINCSFSPSSYTSFRSSSVNGRKRRRRRLQGLSLGLFHRLFLTKNRSQVSEWRRFTRSRYMHLLLREGCAWMFWGEGSFYFPPPWPRRLQRCWSGDDGYLGKDFPATLEMGRIPTKP